ncbi:organ-specific protein S2-like [Solanum dulcamara]|uniref:organ-specific protein S2-like n=1 Tax=Solanum dulcamara TaxID=45834 RepID=UPI0024869AC8|nr:organ-specific protein S2-like [Solanum dulcamara]
MKSPFALILLISLALYASSTDGRKDAGEYWRIVMKNEAMPMAIQRLMPPYDALEPRPTVTTYYHDDSSFKQENSFDPRPTITAYYHDDVGLKQEKSSFTKDFEPRQIVTSYHDNEANLKEEKSFEPRPNVSMYND